MLTRRAGLAGALALSACASRPEPTNEDRVARLLADLEQEVGGRVGLAALDLSTGARIAYRANERFAMCSSFKWLLACFALRRLDPDERIAYESSDLVFYSPVTSEHVGDGMTVRDLCEATVVTSDNTAANLLLRRLDGPRRFTAFLQNHVTMGIRLDRYEPALNENAPGDPRDTATPTAMVRALRRLLVDDGMARGDQDRVLRWMIASRTGLDRLRGGFPADWRAGDKTGTSDETNNATVDVAIAWPPNKSGPILAAAFLSNSTVDLAARKAAHARIGRMIAAAWG
ncbi:MAG: class A beta-lactamase [Hyphomonadaceae bacterium]|nr:class A beta-lactamase [Hyphomonadaceae bacterium]